MKTAVTMLGEAFRQWQRDWDNYDNGIGFKPPSYEQFINPYLEKEKEQIKPLVDALEDIINWNDDLEEDWGDAGYRAKYALETYNQNK